MMVPAGLSMAKATASGIEWFTWMGSTVKQPSLIFCRARSPQTCLTGKAELLQLVFDQAAGQAGAVHRQAELLQQIGNAANVVLVAVGDEQTLDLILVLHHNKEAATPIHIYPLGGLGVGGKKNNG